MFARAPGHRVSIYIGLIKEIQHYEAVTIMSLDTNDNIYTLCNSTLLQIEQWYLLKWYVPIHKKGIWYKY